MVWKTPLIRTGLLRLCKPSEAILGTLHREASVKMQRWNGACHFGLGEGSVSPLLGAAVRMTSAWWEGHNSIRALRVCHYALYLHETQTQGWRVRA